MRVDICPKISFTYQEAIDIEEEVLEKFPIIRVDEIKKTDEINTLGFVFPDSYKTYKALGEYLYKIGLLKG